MQNHSVIAAYVTAGDILYRESFKKMGVPFLFYIGDKNTIERYVGEKLNLMSVREDNSIEWPLQPYFNAVKEKEKIHFFSPRNMLDILKAVDSAWGVIDLEEKLKNILAISHNNFERECASLLLAEIQKIETHSKDDIPDRIYYKKKRGWYRNQLVSYNVPYCFGPQHQIDKSKNIETRCDMDLVVFLHTMKDVKKKRNSLTAKLLQFLS